MCDPNRSDFIPQYNNLNMLSPQGVPMNVSPGRLPAQHFVFVPTPTQFPPHNHVFVAQPVIQGQTKVNCQFLHVTMEKLSLAQDELHRQFGDLTRSSIPMLDYAKARENDALNYLQQAEAIRVQGANMPIGNFQERSEIIYQRAVTQRNTAHDLLERERAKTLVPSHQPHFLNVPLSQQGRSLDPNQIQHARPIQAGPVYARVPLGSQGIGQGQVQVPQQRQPLSKFGQGGVVVPK